MTEIKEYDGYVIHVLIPKECSDEVDFNLHSEWTFDDLLNLGAEIDFTGPISFTDTVPSTWEGPASGSRRA